MPSPAPGADGSGTPRYSDASGCGLSNGYWGLTPYMN